MCVVSFLFFLQLLFISKQSVCSRICLATLGILCYYICERLQPQRCSQWQKSTPTWVLVLFQAFVLPQHNFLPLFSNHLCLKREFLNHRQFYSACGCMHRCERSFFSMYACFSFYLLVMLFWALVVVVKPQLVFCGVIFVQFSDNMLLHAMFQHLTTYWHGCNLFGA